MLLTQHKELLGLRDALVGHLRTAEGLLELDLSVDLAHSVVRNLQCATSYALELERNILGLPRPIQSRD